MLVQSQLSYGSSPFPHFPWPVCKLLSFHNDEPVSGWPGIRISCPKNTGKRGKTLQMLRRKVTTKSRLVEQPLGDLPPEHRNLNRGESRLGSLLANAVAAAPFPSSLLFEVGVDSGEINGLTRSSHGPAPPIPACQ